MTQADVCFELWEPKFRKFFVSSADNKSPKLVTDNCEIYNSDSGVFPGDDVTTCFGLRLTEVSMLPSFSELRD